MTGLSGTTHDRLAEIEERCEFFGQHSGWVTLPSRDVLALVEIAKAARVVNGDGVGEFDTRTTAALLPLRSALARLDSGADEPDGGETT